MQGKFTPKVEKEVVVWPPPSPDGDWTEVRDSDGEVVEKDGKPVKRHSPPEGFENRASRNEFGVETNENYVKVEKGQIVRDHHGNALSCPEGGAAVVHPDGTHEVIQPQDLKKFLRTHDQVSDSQISEEVAS